jgi:hypothetical protein
VRAFPNPLNPQLLISHLTNSNECGNLQVKVLLTVSPSRPSFPPQLHVYQRAFSTIHPLFSTTCRLPAGLSVRLFRRNTRGWVLQGLCGSVSLWRSNFFALCFHILTNCSPRDSLVLITIPFARGCGVRVASSRHSFTQSVVCEGPFPLHGVASHFQLSTFDCEPQFPPSLTTFRINTCKCVTKQMTLSIFRINTYAKSGEGGLVCHRLFRAQPRTI